MKGKNRKCLSYLQVMGRFYPFHLINTMLIKAENV